MRTVFTLLFAVPLLLVGCTTENSLGIDPISPSTEAVPMIIESAMVAAQVETRDISGPNFSKNIRVFLDGPASSYTSQIADYKYSLVPWNIYAKSWNAVDKPLMLKDETAFVWAYYPADVVLKYSNQIYPQVDLFVESDIEGKEFAYATQTPMNKSSRSVSFQMKRAYSHIRIYFRMSDYPIKDVSITDIEIKGLREKAILNIRYGNYIYPPSLYPYVWRNSVGFNFSANGPYSDTVLADLLVPPQPSVDITIGLKMNGVFKSVTLPGKYLPPAGYELIFVTDWNGATLKIESVKLLDDWIIDSEKEPYLAF